MVCTRVNVNTTVPISMEFDSYSEKLEKQSYNNGAVNQTNKK